MSRPLATGEGAGRRGRAVKWISAGLASSTLIFLLPVVLLAGAGNPPCQATAAPGPAAAGSGGFLETAYGPPWGGINGGGRTTYGIDLTGGQPMLEIAIDPTVLKPLAFYHVWPNPFATHGAFIAGDTGGAIVGQHIDTYDWLGRARQDAWGVRSGVTVSKAANPGAGWALGQAQSPVVTAAVGEQSCIGPGGYANPFVHSTSITPLRIDMGVDYTGTGPIGALGDATITLSTPYDPGWANLDGSAFACAGGHAGAVVYRLIDGPQTGRYVYVTEGIVPTAQVGQHVSADQAIATFTGCIETGWASGPGDTPMAAALGQQCASGDPGCHSTYCGQTMSDLIHAAGGPAGILVPPHTGSSC